MQSAIAREYHALLSDLEHLIGTATSMSSEELSSAKAALGARIDAARSTIGHAGEVVMDRAKRSACGRHFGISRTTRRHSDYGHCWRSARGFVRTGLFYAG